jgi:hypothetical protein
MQLSPEGKTDEGLLYPEWQKLYRQVVLELDKEKLRECIAAAETAISKHLQAIAGESKPSG